MKMNALKYNIPKLLLAVICALSLTFDVVAAKPDNPGNPGTGSGGKPEKPSGGKPDKPGGGKPDKPGGGVSGGGGKPDILGRGKGGLYSDLVVLHRDEHGRPILTSQPLVEGGNVMCLQPISANPIQGEDIVTNPADGRDVSLIPLGTGVEGEECDVNSQFAQYVQEVLFGRLNVGRAPVKVLNQQLREVTANLASSVLPIDIDEGGRFVWYSGDTLITGVEVDSPGNNLAIHKELQVAAVLEDQTQVQIVLPPAAAGFLDHAAAALGAAAGKGDLINLDLLVYNNHILEIPDSTTALTTIVGNGTNGETGERYIDYTDYSYNRAATFPGCVRGLLVDFPEIGLSTPFSGSIMDCVFGSIESDGTCVASPDANFTGATAVHAFAQRADDARAVIAFVHDNVVADSTAILPAVAIPPSLAKAGVDQAGEDEVCSAP